PEKTSDSGTPVEHPMAPTCGSGGRQARAGPAAPCGSRSASAVADRGPAGSVLPPSFASTRSWAKEPRALPPKPVAPGTLGFLPPAGRRRHVRRVTGRQRLRLPPGRSGDCGRHWRRLPRGYIPFGDRGVLIHQPCHGRARLGRAALGRFLEKPAQLDLRLQLVLDRGPEADLLPGKRIDPAVHRDPE